MKEDHLIRNEAKMMVHSTSLRELKDVPEYVPMDLLNEVQAEINHNQSLDTLNRRMGLGVLELLDNIHRRRLSYRKETQADVEELKKLISHYCLNHKEL